MKLKDIKLKTCPFCDGEGVLIHSKPDDGYIYSEGGHAFVKCKECDACGPMPDVEYNHAESGYPGRLKAINKAIELAVMGERRMGKEYSYLMGSSVCCGIHYGSPANWKLNSPRVIRLISQ